MNILKKTLLTLSLLTSSLIAEDSAYYSSPLVGIELGLSSIKSETYTTSNTSYSSNNNNVGFTGLKIGAETKHYRIFLNSNYYIDNNDIYDYFITYGIQGQYLFDVSSNFDLFIGLEGGLANINFKLANENFSRSVTDTYIGADAGINIKTEDFDIEFGGRVLGLDAENINNNVVYKHNRVSSIYLSLIFKYDKD